MLWLPPGISRYHQFLALTCDATVVSIVQWILGHRNWGVAMVKMMSLHQGYPNGMPMENNLFATCPKPYS